MRLLTVHCLYSTGSRGTVVLLLSRLIVAMGGKEGHGVREKREEEEEEEDQVASGGGGCRPSNEWRGTCQRRVARGWPERRSVCGRAVRECRWGSRVTYRRCQPWMSSACVRLVPCLCRMPRLYRGRTGVACAGCGVAPESERRSDPYRLDHPALRSQRSHRLHGRGQGRRQHWAFLRGNSPCRKAVEQQYSV